MLNKIKSFTDRIITYCFAAILLAFILNTAQLCAQNDSLHKSYSDTVNYSKMQDSLMKIYSQQSKDYEKMMNKQQSKQRGLGSSLFGLTLDIIFGVGISNTQFDVNGDTTGLSNANSKTGPMIGVNVNFNLLLGVKYEHGGLNDMIEKSSANSYVSSVKARNWFIYSGIKFIL